MSGDDLDDALIDAGLEEALRLLADEDAQIERAQSDGEDRYPFREEE